ncbi:unnamed protein product [Mytilus edulis]|uniref:C-type lectin domain-containing protein n=1 Tax=Mytilus edulis TaxID=6550 RepID=A0A8S3TEZ5_MYTED|nr:unnamed protein product [Mytilus edulis]
MNLLDTIMIRAVFRSSSVRTSFSFTLKRKRSDRYHIDTCCSVFVICLAICYKTFELDSSEKKHSNGGFISDVTNSAPPHGYWLGLTDVVIQNEWTWIESGRELSNMYSHWEKGQPDSRQSENCGILWHSTGFTWHDDFCSDKLAFFICEKELRPGGSEIIVANGACPNGWFSHGLSCYFYSKTSVDFADAMVFCKNIDAVLVEIESDDENKFIQNSLKNITLKVPPHGYWIGLTDIEIENEWKWIESGNSVSYVNWNPGQPDLRQSENCGILWYSTGFTWHDDFCSDNLAFFICEKEREV